MQLGNLPRVRLANLPTPLEEAPRLTEFLGGPRIWIKRDDLTGLALGGNKARKLEFLLGQAREQGCVPAGKGDGGSDSGLRSPNPAGRGRLRAGGHGRRRGPAPPQERGGPR